MNARLAALKAVLDLTPDQEKLWTPLEAAVRDAAKESAERANELHNGRMLAPAPRPLSLAWRTGRTIGYWWAYRSPSPTPQNPDHYVRRLVSGLFVGLGVYVLFWPTVVLLLILAVSFGY